MSDASDRSLRARLQQKERRPLDRITYPIAHAPPSPISVSRAHEISALAVGLLVLKYVEDTGRTRLHEQAIQDSLKRVTEHVTAAEMMRLEVEAYEIVDWLVGGNGASAQVTFVASRESDGVRYDPSSSIPDIVREAVAQGFDLKVAYYSSKRMEMNTRVISPKAIAAEVYVRAWCHERKDERIFRMDRIRSAVPVNGRPITNPFFERVLSEQEDVQQSLDLEHLSFDTQAFGLATIADSLRNDAETVEVAALAQSRAIPVTLSAEAPRESVPAASPSLPEQECAQASPSSAVDSTDASRDTESTIGVAPQISAPAPELILRPTPTDAELQQMALLEKRRVDEKSAQEAAEAAQDQNETSDDGQLSFF